VVSPLPYPFSALGLLLLGEPEDVSGTRATGDQRRPGGGAAAASGGGVNGGGSAAAAAGDLSICTGLMVSPDLVLTAAHVSEGTQGELRGSQAARLGSGAHT
jgi:hypothetical protein